MADEQLCDHCFDPQSVAKQLQQAGVAKQRRSDPVAAAAEGEALAGQAEDLGERRTPARGSLLQLLPVQPLSAPRPWQTLVEALPLIVCLTGSSGASRPTKRPCDWLAASRYGQPDTGQPDPSLVHPEAKATLYSSCLALPSAAAAGQSSDAEALSSAGVAPTLPPPAVLMKPQIRKRGPLGPSSAAANATIAPVMTVEFDGEAAGDEKPAGSGGQHEHEGEENIVGVNKGHLGGGVVPQYQYRVPGLRRRGIRPPMAS